MWIIYILNRSLGLARGVMRILRCKNKQTRGWCICARALVSVCFSCMYALHKCEFAPICRQSALQANVWFYFVSKHSYVRLDIIRDCSGVYIFHPRSKGRGWQMWRKNTLVCSEKTVAIWWQPCIGAVINHWVPFVLAHPLHISFCLILFCSTGFFNMRE